MQNTQTHEDFDLEVLQSKMNSYDWSRIDCNISPLPKNPYYQVIIEDLSIQKYYQRFRFIMQNQNTHLSPQALALSTYLLKASTNNYYALMLRKKYVFNQLQNTQNPIQSQFSQQMSNITKRNNVFERQLNFMNNLLEDNPKEYHIWTYKKDLISKIIAISQQTQNWAEKPFLSSFKENLYYKENQFIFALLIQDCRNYHAWDYRFWLVTFVNKIQLELKWIDDLIAESRKQSFLVKQIKEKLSSTQMEAKQLKINWANVNSLWSHKFNLIRFMKQKNSKVPQNLKEKIELNQNKEEMTLISDEAIRQMVNKEIQVSTRLVSEDRQNQCIWNYLKGMIRFSEGNYASQTGEKQQFKFIRETIFNVENWESIEPSLERFNRFQLSFLRNFNQKIVPLQHRLQFQQKIINQFKIIDSVRMKYYQYQERNLEKK